MVDEEGNGIASSLPAESKPAMVPEMSKKTGGWDHGAFAKQNAEHAKYNEGQHVTKRTYTALESGPGHPLIEKPAPRDSDNPAEDYLDGWIRGTKDKAPKEESALYLKGYQDGLRARREAEMRAKEYGVRRG